MQKERLMDLKAPGSRTEPVSVAVPNGSSLAPQIARNGNRVERR